MVGGSGLAWPVVEAAVASSGVRDQEASMLVEIEMTLSEYYTMKTRLALAERVLANSTWKSLHDEFEQG